MPSEIPRLIMCKILFPWVIIELSMQNTVWHHVWTRVENEIIIEWYCSINQVGTSCSYNGPTPDIQSILFSSSMYPH